EVPGMAEAMRAASLRVTPAAMLSRAVAGVRNRTLIVNLPGSPKGVRETLAAIVPALPHAVLTLRGGVADHERPPTPAASGPGRRRPGPPPPRRPPRAPPGRQPSQRQARRTDSRHRAATRRPAP